MPEYRDAFLLPGERIDRRTTSLGLFGPEGEALRDTAIVTSSWTTRPPAHAQPPSAAPLLFGPALFAGSVDKQFGFVLLNSLGRLWALDALPAQTTLVFAAKAQAKPTRHAIVPAILRALGVLHPILITETALRFEQLHTAEERFGECHGGRGTAEFYDWIDRRWPAASAPDPIRKIYVTRSGLGPAAGRFACEDHLEQLLQAEGYDIYRPEAHDIAHQVQTFQAAGKLIFAEGSALHLFALIRRPGQVSAVIHRRAALPAVMLAQMSDRAGQGTAPINAVTAEYWPKVRGDHLGRSVLDFHHLRDRLMDLGLIRGRGWTAPSEAAVRASLLAGLAAGEDVMTADQRADWLKTQRKARRRG